MSLESATDEVIRRFPREVAAYRSGHTASIHVLVGQVKRLSHSQGNTAEILKTLQERLGMSTTVAVPEPDGD
jgi:Asp-tRNA(Asn)/Glu-tRNA(Gln) amidotransferase B subunit